MSRKLFSALVGILVAVSQVRAQAPLPVIEAAPPSEPPAEAWSVDGTFGNGRVWAEADFLLWWMRGDSLPPLVTTSPAGTPISQAGVLGGTGTTVLFGDSTVNGDLRAGGRIAVGCWCDKACTLGIEADFFMLENKAAHFAATSGGDPILARPFIDAGSRTFAAERIAFPGDLSGSVAASAETTGLLGTGLRLRETVCCGCDYRLDVLGGYRYLRLTDRLAVTESLTNVNPNNPNFIPVGANIAVADRFGTKNDFQALDLGLAGELRRGPLGLTVRGTLAVGLDHQVVEIDGGTTVTVAGLPPAVSSGGLLALGSNSGHHSRNQVAVVPELNVKLSYQVTPRLTASVGYTYLYWSDAVRAGDQVDTTVNPTLIPPVVNPSGPTRPVFTFQRAAFWAQGIDLGLEFRY
jgi:hypothetical protein